MAEIVTWPMWAKTEKFAAHETFFQVTGGDMVMFH